MKRNHSGGGNVKVTKNQMCSKIVCSGKFDTTQFMSAMPNWSRELFALRPKGWLTGVLISPYPDLLPDVYFFFFLLVRTFRLMLVMFYIYE